MDVPKYKIIFRKQSESDLHFYERCKKIKADENRLREIRCEINRVYDQFSDSEKLMVELDME